MDSKEPRNIHKETRISLEPTSSAFLLDVHIQRRPSKRRSRLGAAVETAAEYERTFRADNCATASAVYHRQWHDAPQSFLWRVLEDNTVLNVRAIDVSRTTSAHDANLVLNIHFAKPIRPSCVALADPRDRDELSVFVLDEDQNLHTLALRPDFFRTRVKTEEGVLESHTVHKVSGLSFKVPHRLVPLNDELIVVTAHDGANIRLDRSRTHDRLHYSSWQEAIYNSKGWLNGLHSFWKSGHTVPYNGVNMEFNAAASAIATDFGLRGAPFLFTICLDHRLRVWDLNTGHILAAQDLMGAERDPQEIGKWTIDPSQTNLIKSFGKVDGTRVFVTFSPIGAGEFKFWKAEAENAGGISIGDCFPAARLVPSPPAGTDVWTLADFSVNQGANGDILLWLLWKNNMTYRVHHLSSPLAYISDAWQSQWSGVFPDDPLPITQAAGPWEATDVAERWLQTILFPGRFTKATLETALSIYEQGLNMKPDPSSRTAKGLAESMCAALNATSSLERGSSGELNFAQYRHSTHDQWQRFYRLLQELDKQRGEALALCCDGESVTPWVVCADSVSAIRQSSPLEEICHNPLDKPDGRLATESTLVLTGLDFVSRMHHSMRETCYSVLRSELLEESPKSDFDRISYYYDKAGFWRQLSDDDIAEVTEAFGENFSKLSGELYTGLAYLMRSPQRQSDDTHPLTEFGKKLAIKALQGMADLQWMVHSSQLILLVHMETEFDVPEEALHNRIDVGRIYRDLVKSLKRLEHIRWMAKTAISVPITNNRFLPAAADTNGNRKSLTDDQRQITVLEGMLDHLLGTAVPNSFSTVITDKAASICALDSDIPLPPYLTQCRLLVQTRPDLAVELGPLCDTDPFPTYIQGRVYFAMGDFGTAAGYFKKAAYGLSDSSTGNPQKHSSGLLDDMDWGQLYAGLFKYYAHIMMLYENKAPSYVVEFGRLALQFFHRKDANASFLLMEVQECMFEGAVENCQFDLAHSTLVTMQDLTRQRSLLGKLIIKMCENLHNSALVSLPFPGMENAVDDKLVQLARGTVDVVTGYPYHQILYAWRIKHNDYRGAAAILFDRIQKLKKTAVGDEQIGEDVLDTVITRQYLIVINVLACVEEKQAWITTEDVPELEKGSTDLYYRGKREVKTLAQIRKEYQQQLDEIAAVHNNEFGFDAGDAMDLVT